MVASLAATAIASDAAASSSRWPFYQAPAARPAPDVRPAPAIKRRQTDQPQKRKHAADAVNMAEKIPPGPLHIVISIKQQRLTLYANGVPFAQSPVSTGVPGHPTPLGVFSIIQKNLHHRSNIYSGAPMPFMQRITWSGVAMHEGKLPGYPASHGCIRLPREFAQRLWRITRIGARVIIAQDDVALADIANPRLFASPEAAGAASEAPFTKIRIATTAPMSDMTLKGSIDANAAAREEAQRIEKAIDQAVQAGWVDGSAMEDEQAIADDPEKPDLAESAKDPMLRPGPISVYISRKTGRLYVRKGFEEVFDAPVTIAGGDRPLGTHLFTALHASDDAGLRWSVASLPTDRVVKQGKYLQTITRGEKLRKELVPPVHETTPPGDPREALDRVTIPDDARARINELMTPGATLIISDLGLSHETGRGTDFIVLTR